MLLNGFFMKSSSLFFNDFRDLTLKNNPNKAIVLRIILKNNYFELATNIECKIVFSFSLNISVMLTKFHLLLKSLN